MKSQFVEAMDRLQEDARKGDLTLQRVVEILGEEGHAIFMLFVCLPYLIPVPIPGLSTPSGILVIIVATRLYLRKPFWIPKRYEGLKISAKTVVRVSEAVEKIWRKLVKFIKQRWTFLHDSHSFRILNLMVFVLNAFLLSLPLPIPFSNSLPGIAIILLSLGHTEKDGLFILISYLWTLLVIAFFFSLGLGAKALL